MNDQKIISRNTTAQKFHSLQEIEESEDRLNSSLEGQAIKNVDPFDYLNEEENEDQSECSFDSDSSSALMLEIDQTQQRLQLQNGEIAEENDNEYNEDNTFIKGILYQNVDDPDDPSQGANSTKQSSGYFCNEDGLFYENPNIDFQTWDFHPNEPEVPAQITYSASIESLRITLNTYMKKSLKQPFQTNTKKAIIQVVKGEDFTFDEHLRQNLLLPAQKELDDKLIEYEPIQNREYQKFVNKYYVTRRMNTWLQSYQIEQFHKSKLFKHISKLYLNIDKQLTEWNNGSYPCFVISMKAIKTKKEEQQQSVMIFKKQENKQRKSVKKKLVIGKQVRSKPQSDQNVISVTNANKNFKELSTQKLPNILFEVKQSEKIKNILNHDEVFQKLNKLVASNKVNNKRPSHLSKGKELTKQISTAMLRNISTEQFATKADKRYKQGMNSQLGNNKKIENTQHMNNMSLMKTLASPIRTQKAESKMELTKQYPLIRFDQNPGVKLESLITTNGQKDGRLFDMLNQIYFRSQFEKCQLFQQYYMKKLQDKSKVKSDMKSERQSQLRQRNNTIKQMNLNDQQIIEMGNCSPKLVFSSLDCNFISNKSSPSKGPFTKKKSIAEQSPFHKEYESNTMSLPYIHKQLDEFDITKKQVRNR